MTLRIDAHVHFYPCYDLRTALDSLRANLAASSNGAHCMAFLAERSDCHFFAECRERVALLPGAQIQVDRQENVLLLREEGYPDLYIFPGRQITTRERIEILALTTDQSVPDGLPAQEVIARVRENGGVAVVNWAPGKWFFERGKIVENLLAMNRPGTLLVGDTSLRPQGWPMPLLMKRAQAMGFGLVAGSDPLPFPGEERVMGCYGMEVAAPFDPADPAGSVRTILSATGFRPQLIGRRGRPLATLLRLIRNGRVRKDPAHLAAT